MKTPGRDRFQRAYLEILNVCGQRCSFCPGCSRSPRTMTLEEFDLYTDRLLPYTDCLCLHVMGEPTLHPDLDRILQMTDRKDYRVILTTNGWRLSSRADVLLSHRSLYKVQISLHSFEGSAQRGDRYFEDCFDFAERASAGGIVTVLRLWNANGREKGRNALNDAVLAAMRARFSGFWKENARGYCIREKLYLEYDVRFVWPDETGKPLRNGGFCHALSRQIAVLADGTVVPCCLDGQGAVPLGNLKEETVEQILQKPIVQKAAQAFRQGGAFVFPLCRSCGYADRFNE